LAILADILRSRRSLSIRRIVGKHVTPDMFSLLDLSDGIENLPHRCGRPCDGNKRLAHSFLHGPADGTFLLAGKNLRARQSFEVGGERIVAEGDQAPKKRHRFNHRGTVLFLDVVIWKHRFICNTVVIHYADAQVSEHHAQQGLVVGVVGVIILCADHRGDSVDQPFGDHPVPQADEDGGARVIEPPGLLRTVLAS
jgi:hypothetical protein